MGKRNSSVEHQNSSVSKTKKKMKKNNLANGDLMGPILKDKGDRKQSIEVDMMTYSMAIARPATDLTPSTMK